jgi:hypothetical protein
MVRRKFLGELRELLANGLGGLEERWPFGLMKVDAFLNNIIAAA